MSYCRWSSDDYQCDVYVFEDVNGGYTTIVADTRFLYKEPLPPEIKISGSFNELKYKKWEERQRTINDLIDKADKVAIGLPFDGEEFNDSTPGECATRLEMLRTCGYNVPQYAIDALKEEEAEQEKTTSFIPMEDK